MKFEVQRDEKIVEGIVRYIKSDYAFDFDPIQSSSYAVMINDLTISVDSDLKVRQVWGYNPFGGWIVKKLVRPSVIKGSLILVGSVEDVQRIEGSKGWKTYYDATSGWVCIGDCDLGENKLAVEFATNTIAILKDNNIKALWVKPVFI